MPADPYKYFRIEARELLDQLQSGLLKLESGGHDLNVLSTLLRHAHTLKGAARVVALASVADAAHGLEDVLVAVKQGVHPTSDLSSALSFIDSIATELAALPLPGVAQERTKTQAAPVSEATSWLEASAPKDGRALGTIVELLSTASVQLEALRQSMSGHDRSPSASGPGEPLLSENVGVRRMFRRLDDGFDELRRSLLSARTKVEELRLAPVSTIFPALERTARDSALSLGRPVNIQFAGGDLRVGQQVLAKIQQALIQLVRNAVAHGMEPQAERRASGKADQGRIVVKAERRGRRMVFSCADDGRGVDVLAVAEALAEHQSAIAAQVHNPEQALRVLLEGGVSTSPGTSQIAGRGIGLDLVRSIAVQFGGTLEGTSNPGKGTEISLWVPGQLSVTQGLLLHSDGVEVVLPVSCVVRSMTLTKHQVQVLHKRSVVQVDDRAIPFAPLAQLLANKQMETRERWQAVLLHAHGAQAILGVDQIGQIADVIVQPVPALTPASQLVSGFGTAAHGLPQLILDPGFLVEAVSGAPGLLPVAELTRRPILVIDDSLTTRMLEQSILETAGYSVETAASGEEGLEKARSAAYGLFLVDVDMPGMDGFAFVEKTRSDPTLSEIPAIVVTSRDSPADRRRGMRAGARAYMTKGEFSQPRLLEIVRGILG